MKKTVLFALVLVLLSLAMIVRGVRPVVVDGTVYIRADGSVQGTDKIQRDGNVYTLTANIYDEIVVEREHIVVDGASYTLQGTRAFESKGIDLSNRSDVTIKNMKIKEFEYGIWLEGSNNTNIFGNTITNNGQGIHMYGSSNTSITGNNIKNNEWDGIDLWYSSNHNSIYGNEITNNSYGIDLYFSSNYNSISGNNITNNGNGIWVFKSSNNTIHNNNFVDNAEQVYSYNSTNVWDDGYPSGGNYWSDYEDRYPDTEEVDDSGIWNTPYVIDPNNRDCYPLTNPWIPREHELITSITAPAYLQLVTSKTAPTHLQQGYSSSLNAIVINKGSSYETNVKLLLLINGTPIDSTTIPLLQAGNLHTISYLWTPTVEGTYNVTAYAHPVPGEASIENNQKTKFITVAEIQVGVKAGDWIQYDYEVAGWPSGTPYPKRVKVEILSVEETTATVRATMHISDGTEQSDTLSVDVVAGGGTFDTLCGFVIPANSKVGDSINIGGDGFTFTVIIDVETTSTYAGARRTVVYTSFPQDGTQLTYYWDKQTGVMVEASVTSGGITGTAKATKTNMWEVAPPPFWMQWWFWTIVIAGIAISAVAVYFSKKRKPPTPTVPTLPMRAHNLFPKFRRLICVFSAGHVSKSVTWQIILDF